MIKLNYVKKNVNVYIYSYWGILLEVWELLNKNLNSDKYRKFPILGE